MFAQIVQDSRRMKKYILDGNPNQTKQSVHIMNYFLIRRSVHLLNNPDH